MTDLPLIPGRTGESVRDVQRRLASLGFDVDGDETGDYGPGTEAAVRAFQANRGLRIDGICGRQTWSSLVEAGYRLGDRFLYLRSPMLRGDDVAELQRLLGILGFDAGRVDGILGPNTVDALTEFQRNVALTSDGICGADTVKALRRLTARVDPDASVAQVRETVRLLASPRQLHDRRLAVAETGGLAALADAFGRALGEAGAVVAVLHHPDESAQAAAANEFNAEAFVGLALHDETRCEAAFYAAEGFESVGGRRLAELVVDELATLRATQVAESPKGMRLPVLRETRMPAVLVELGPPTLVVAHASRLASALTHALSRWVMTPVEP